MLVMVARTRRWTEAANSAIEICAFLQLHTADRHPVEQLESETYAFMRLGGLINHGVSEASIARFSPTVLNLSALVSGDFDDELRSITFLFLTLGSCDRVGSLFPQYFLRSG